MTCPKIEQNRLSTELENMKMDFNSGIAKTEIAKKYDVTRAYVYQLVNQTPSI